MPEPIRWKTCCLLPVTRDLIEQRKAFKGAGRLDAEINSAKDGQT